MSKPIEKVDAAYHEAGHAVVAALQYKKKKNGYCHTPAVPFRYVTLRPRRKFVELEGNVVEAVGHMYSSKSKFISEIDIIALFAGVESERIGQPDGWSPLPSGVSDYIKCFELQKELQISDDKLYDLMKQSRVEVDRAWSAIDAVAQDLLDKVTVSRREVVARCEEHHIKRNVWVLSGELRET